eukprot:COSAG02_NODE_10449_length_1938_cov_2.681349_2_plen_72_part_01
MGTQSNLHSILPESEKWERNGNGMGDRWEHTEYTTSTVRPPPILSPEGFHWNFLVLATDFLSVLDPSPTFGN